MTAKPILDGILVVDFTQFFAGPVVTQLMAELGAEVVKVEIAPTGDQGRLLPFMKNGRSGYFIQQNTGKKSLCLDLKSDRGKAIVRDLIAKADVMVENFTPGVIAKFGFDWETVHALNPRLIMCSVSALGQTGPLATTPGFDFTGQAYAGVSAMIGDPDGPPAMIGLAVGDAGAGMTGFASINAALYHRERTGEGQYLESSLLDYLFRAHEANIEAYSLSGGAIDPHRGGAHHRVYAPIGYYRAKDGYVVLIVTEGQWPSLCKAMGREDMIADPRFANNDARVANLEVLIETIEAWTMSFPGKDELVRVLTEAHVPVAPVLSVAEAVAHPHLIARETVRDIVDPVAGPMKIAGSPLNFRNYPKHTSGPAPLLGEHNAELLGRHLGYDAATIRELEEAGILHAEPAVAGG